MGATAAFPRLAVKGGRLPHPPLLQLHGRAHEVGRRIGFGQDLVLDGARFAEEVPLAVGDVEFEDVDDLAFGLDLLGDHFDAITAGQVGEVGGVDVLELAQSGLGSDGLVLMPSNAFEPSKPVADDPFANLLYQEGRNSVQVYDQVDDGFSFGAEFAVGLKIGASFSSSSTTSTINSAIFLGAPGADGTRGYVNDAVCSLD